MRKFVSPQVVHLTSVPFVRLKCLYNTTQKKANFDLAQKHRPQNEPDYRLNQLLNVFDQIKVNLFVHGDERWFTVRNKPGR